VFDSVAAIEKLVLEYSESHQRKLKWIYLTDYFGFPIPTQIFDLRFILTHTLGQGCAFTSYKGDVRDKVKDWIGKDILQHKSMFLCDSLIDKNFGYSFKVSVLDSIYGNIELPFNKDSYIKETRRINANPEKKNEWRTNIVLDEVKRLLGSSSQRKILNIGAVGSFIEALRKKGYDVIGSDFEEAIINTEVSGTLIRNGNQSPYLAKNVDLVLATGMTISTKTIDKIIGQSKQGKAKIIVFAETGHSFASYYVQNGVDVYLSESFPFYNYKGESVINIYRSL
jgi:hypothetical protein